MRDTGSTGSPRKSVYDSKRLRSSLKQYHNSESPFKPSYRLISISFLPTPGSQRLNFQKKKDSETLTSGFWWTRTPLRSYTYHGYGNQVSLSKNTSRR